MNLEDADWKPPPSDPALLRKVRLAVKTTASAGDVVRLRGLLTVECKGVIPHEVRGMVWAHLLRVNTDEVYVESADDFFKEAADSVRDDNSKEQILKDVSRTRPTMTMFKQEHVRNALTRLMSLFCQRRKVSYIQGFNELLVPFLLLDDVGGNPRLVFALYSAFVNTFVPWILDSAESRVFDVLKRAFRYFGRLLLYFDPNLFWMLDSFFMTPDIYATSWLVTVFARNFTVEATYALWDLLLLEDNALSTYFFGIALILSKREELLTCDESELPEILMNMSATSVDEVHRLWKIGNELRVAQTPPSFQRLMAARLLGPTEKQNATIAAAVQSMQSAVTLQTSLDDIAPGGALHFFTWDCRADAYIVLGKIAQSGIMPLDALRNADELIKNGREEAVERALNNAVELCKPLSGSSHICLIGSGVSAVDELDVNPLALRLTQEGIPCVSTLRGGFKEVITNMENGNPYNIELVDLDLEGVRKLDRKNAKEHGGRRDENMAVQSLTEKSDKEVKDVLNSMLTAHPQRGAPQGSSAVVLPRLDVSTIQLPGLELTNEDLVGDSGPRAPLRSEALPPTLLSDKPAKTPSYRDVSSRTRLPSLKGLAVQSRMDSLSLSGSDSSDSLSESSSNLFNPFSEDASSPVPAPMPRSAPPPQQRRAKSPSRLGARPSVSMRSGASAAPDGTTPIPPTGLDGPPRSSMRPPPAKATEVTQSKDGARAFWGKCAVAGWIGENSLSYPPEFIRKGFTLNIESPGAMQDIQLFPCWTGSGSKSGGSKIYLGIARFYMMFLGPHKSNTTLLVLLALRRFSDLRKLSFRRQAPDNMTVEFAKRADGSLESFTVRILDGRRDAAQLIADYRSNL